MTTEPDAWLDLTAQADLVRRGEAAPAELVQAAIGRIEALNPRLNAVIMPLFEQALEAARGPVPQDVPFPGIPFLLKDLVAEMAGVPLAEGSRFLAGHYVSAADSELVARYRRAGLIVLGKTNTPEFGLVPTTEPLLFGPTRNPWDPERTPGGSSGGSAAAVASGMVAAAHGNDGGGSIRVPAACCGLFGLKPTRGRNPLGPAYGDVASGLAAEHALTRSVRDSAALLDATSGPMPGDPYWPAPPQRPFAREVGADPGCLRIGFATRRLDGGAVHDDCRAAVHAAAKLCDGLGHTVEEASPPVDAEQMAKRFGNVWVGLLGWTIADWARRSGREPTEADFEPLTWRMYQSTGRRTPADYLLAVQDMQAIARQFGAWFQDFDVWLTPTTCVPPVPLGYFAYDPADAGTVPHRLNEFVHFTLPFNITGQPAMSVPLHWNDAGLPVGTQFVGRYGEEATLFRLAAQLESAQPWAHRRPPVCAD